MAPRSARTRRHAAHHGDGVAWTIPPPPAAPPWLGEPGKIGRIVPALPDPVMYPLRRTRSSMPDRVRLRTGAGRAPAPLDTMAPEVTRMASGGTTITWFGHACVEVRTPGDKVVLFDPWFADPRSRAA